MMLKEIQQLIVYVGDDQADKEVYFRAIEADNCLGKRSVRTRQLTARHLVELYSLDPTQTLFHSLLYLWTRDASRSLRSFARMPEILCFARVQLSSWDSNRVRR
jgi:hypothetical protein